MRLDRLTFGLGFVATFVAVISGDLLLPLKSLVIIAAIPVAAGLVGFFSRAGWYTRAHGAVLTAVYGIGAGVVYWGTTRMAQELQEVTYYLTDKSPQGLGMAQYVAPEARAVVPLFRQDIFVFIAAALVVAGLDAAYKARSAPPAVQPTPSA